MLNSCQVTLLPDAQITVSQAVQPSVQKNLPTFPQSIAELKFESLLGQSFTELLGGEVTIDPNSTVADTAGLKGTYKEILPKIKSVVSSWAYDARLLEMKDIVDHGPTFNVTVGKEFYYTSDKLKEDLDLRIGGEEAFIIKKKFTVTNKDLDKSKVTINPETLLDKITAAIKDKTVMPETVDPNSVYPPPCVHEIIYDIPASVIWEFSLAEDNQKLYWEFNYETPPDPNRKSQPYNVSVPAGTFSDYYNTGYAKIDAQTGEITKLKRMQLVHMSVVPSPLPPNFTCPPTPLPSPAVSGSPK